MLPRSLLCATIALTLFAPVPASAQGSLTVYCSALAEWCEVMRRDFAAKSGIRVLMTVKSTGETLAQIRAERSNPRGDIWWAGTSDPHLEAAADGLTEEYRSPQLDKLHPWARRQAEISGFHSVGIYAGPLGIVWNTQALAKRKLPEPECWADLIKPAYRGEVQMSSPATSGTSYMALATLVQLMGEDKAFEYLRALHRNINQYPRAGGASMMNVVRGETVLAISWMSAAVAEKALGAPVVAVAPCEGTVYEVGSMSIIKGGKNPDAARTWYEFALTSEAQATGVIAKSYQVPARMDAPLPPGTPRLEDVKLIDYDFAKFAGATVRKRLLDRWEREVAGQPR